MKKNCALKRAASVGFALIWLLNSAFLMGQVLEPKWAVRADLDGFLNQKAAISLENRFKNRGGLELECQFRSYRLPQTGAKYFNGTWTTEWLDERIDSTRFPGAVLVNAPSWKYVGIGRPLPEVAPTAAIFSVTGRLGYRFRFKTASKRGEWSVEPTISVSAHRFWSVAETIDGPQNLIFEKRSDLPYSGHFIIRTEQRYFQQTRVMREKTVVVPGLFYQIGRMQRLSQRLFFEVRAGGGLNFTPPELEKGPAPISLFYSDFSIKMGCFLDRCVDDLPPKKPFKIRLKKQKKRPIETL